MMVYGSRATYGCCLKDHVNDRTHVLPTLCPPCWLNCCAHSQDGNSPLHLAAVKGRTTCVEHLLSTPGIDVNNNRKVSWSIESSLLWGIVLQKRIQEKSVYI